MVTICRIHVFVVLPAINAQEVMRSMGISVYVLSVEVSIMELLQLVLIVFQ